jgi:hypothetical protein
MDPASKALDAISLGCSYIVNSQHDIKPAQTKFKPGEHTGVNMSYTWTLRNFTLPVTATMGVASDVFFAGFGAGEFFMQMLTETMGEDLVSIYTRLYRPTAPEHIKLPLQVNYTYKLIDNACGLVENAILERHTGLGLCEREGDIMDTSKLLNYSANVKMLVEKHQCVTIKHRVVYDV